MKKFIQAFLIVLISCNNLIAQETDTSTTYFLIRHAEKDRTDPSNKDPFLTQDGLARALKWADVFKDVAIHAVYSTAYNRTRQTAQPTALLKKQKIRLYNPKLINIDTFKKETQGKTVLIVGHSNSTPNFVNKLIGQSTYQSMDDRDNASLYIVTITGNRVSHMVLKIH